MDKGPRGVRWCFTINNPSDDDLQSIKNLGDGPMCKYIIAEHEHINGDGTPHVQGYLRLTSRQYRATVETWLGGRAHVEIAKGSEEANIKYCTKENNVFINQGTPVKGAAILLDKDEEARQLIADMRYLTEEEFEAKRPNYYKNHTDQVRKFRHEYLITMQQVFDGVLKGKNYWIWGPAGTGKSKVSRTGIEIYHIFSKPWNKWWNGYNPDIHTRIIIEDWPSAPQGDALCQHLKIWADRYPFTAETKGGHIAVSPTYQLFVTSNYKIDQCFSNDEDREAIRRRFTEIYWSGDKESLEIYMEAPVPH
uniref:Replication-associated protein n=1 Tax=Rodent circovirus TaxID=2050016 RepID=A0A2H4MWW1_9CIRC|nr:Rep [Rodent circovirus]